MRTCPNCGKRIGEKYPDEWYECSCGWNEIDGLPDEDGKEANDETDSDVTELSK